MKNIAHGGAFSFQVREDRPGYLVAVVCGKNAAVAFENESGGHRWQRVPPTENHGRVQTSTITVCVRPFNSDQIKIQINREDVVETTYRGSGKGGQHRNKKDTAVRLQYQGIIVVAENERSQSMNRSKAWKELERRVGELVNKKHDMEISSNRKQQVGSGMRGDKRRTYREKDNRVVDHVTGKKISLAQVLHGGIEGLWE